MLTTCLLPIIPKTIHSQIPAAITHRLETPSDSIPENLHFNQLGREAEDYFNEEVLSSRFSLLSAGDPFVVVEMEEFLPSSWPVVLLPPKRVNKRVPLSFLKDLKVYFTQLYKDAFILLEPRIDMFARCKVNGTTFSSQFNRTERGSTILAYCVDRDIQGVDRVSSSNVLFFSHSSFFAKRQF